MENISHATLKALDCLINLTVNSATSSLLMTAPVPVTAGTLLMSVASEQGPGSLQDRDAQAQPTADVIPLQPGATLRAGSKRRCCLLCHVISYKPLGFALGITKCLDALFAFYSLTARISKSSEVGTQMLLCSQPSIWLSE